MLDVPGVWRELFDFEGFFDFLHLYFPEFVLPLHSLRVCTLDVYFSLLAVVKFVARQRLRSPWFWCSWEVAGSRNRLLTVTFCCLLVGFDGGTHQN